MNFARSDPDCRTSWPGVAIMWICYKYLELRVVGRKTLEEADREHAEKKRLEAQARGAGTDRHRPRHPDRRADRCPDGTGTGAGTDALISRGNNGVLDVRFRDLDRVHCRGRGHDLDQGQARLSDGPGKGIRRQDRCRQSAIENAQSEDEQVAELDRAPDGPGADRDRSGGTRVARDRKTSLNTDTIDGRTDREWWKLG